MSGDVTVQFASQARTVAVTYIVADAPPIQRRYASTIKFQPDRMLVTFIDGELTGCQISGPRVLKGRLGDRETERYPGYSITDGDLPGWALPYVKSPPRQRPTVLLTNDDLARVLAGSEMGCSGYTEPRPGGSPAAREPAEFMVRLYTPEELLEAARRLRRAAADATANPDVGVEMTLGQAVTLTKQYDLWKMLGDRRAV